MSSFRQMEEAMWLTVIVSALLQVLQSYGVHMDHNLVFVLQLILFIVLLVCFVLWIRLVKAQKDDQGK